MNVLNVNTPLGNFDPAATYVAQTIFGGTGSAPLYVSCPTVSSAGGVYYATGFDRVSGLPAQPTVGVLPATDTAWSILSQGDGSGSVTTLSVVTANGLEGTVANPTTTPAITLSTSVTGFLQGDGTAISAAATLGSGTDLALTATSESWTPTISVVTPGDLNIVYNQQFGKYQRIGNMGFLSFYLAATVTHTTASGIFNIVGLPAEVINMGDEASGVMDVFVKATPIYTAGYTVYTSWMDGSGSNINIVAQSTNPAIDEGKVLFIQDIDSGTSFKFRGLLTFPIYI